MGFLLGGLVLLISGLILRRFLGLSGVSRKCAWLEERLSREQAALFTPFSTEVETQATIISVSLNDAIDECNAGHDQAAWRLVQISAGEWRRVAAILTGLLELLQRNLPRADSMIAYRGMVVRRFKSPAMAEYLRMYHFLEMVVFRSHMRFRLQVRTLKGALAALTREFTRAYQYGDQTGDRLPELWHRLDIFTHDFDLLTKEALMATRAMLASLPPEDLPQFAAAMKACLAAGAHRDAVLTRF